MSHAYAVKKDGDVNWTAANKKNQRFDRRPPSAELFALGWTRGASRQPGSGVAATRLRRDELEAWKNVAPRTGGLALSGGLAQDWSDYVGTKDARRIQGIFRPDGGRRQTSLF